MKCPGCQHESPPGAKFCAECGGPLARDCTRCGTRLPDGAKFCPECAQPVAAATAPGSRFASPADYTPKHIADKVRSSRSALEGERKQVTVLFADLKGSMELLANRDPEEARHLLDPVVTCMVEAVHRYDGTVNQVMGDGIMALFGAPLAHEDHALRACYAALAMQVAVRRLSDGARRGHAVVASIRVGLNSGEVVVRAIGNDLRVDYTAVGQTTHLAARMEQLAIPGTILFTAETLRLVQGFVDFKPLGPTRIKGLAEPVEIFQLIGAGPIRSRLQAAAARGLSPLVGRQTELQILEAARQGAGAGRGQIVGVVGEPGVGKSRLYWEFTHSEPLAGWRILTTGSVSYGKATAYLPLINLLRDYFGLDDQATAESHRDRLMTGLRDLGDVFQSAIPAILTLLDVPVEDESWRKLDPERRRQATLDAVKRLLLRESQVQPLLLLIEDLHWIDSETQALLDSLVDSLPTARLLLLVNYRPEYQHGWGGRTYYTQIRLDPLSAPSAEALLRTLLGEDAAFPPLMHLLIERTEGNPFFLEETVRSLLEIGVVTGAPGAYRLVKPLAGLEVPATVQAVLAARIDRLPPDEKHLLQSAAVIGKDVPLALLEVIAGGPDELHRWLAHLQAAEFLYETRLFPDPEYTFKHALTLEVAYGSLLRERRRVLHVQVLDALERLYAHRLAEKIELLAHHAVRGEAWDRAARYLYQAGEKAIAQARAWAGASFLQSTVDALDHVGEAADLTLKLDAFLELWVTKVSTSQLEGLQEVGEKAEALARALNDDSRLAKVQVRQAQAIALMGLLPGTFESAIERAREAYHHAEPGDLRTRSYAQFVASVSCRDLGRLRDAIAETDRGLALFPSLAAGGTEAGLILPIYVSLCAWRSEVYATLGEFDAALASATEALRVAGEIRLPSTLTVANAFLGYCRLLKGDIEEAIPALQRGLTLAQEHDIPHGVTANSLYLAYALVLSSRHDPGLEALARARMQTPIVFMPQWTRYGTVPAVVYLLGGRLAEAASEADRGLALAAERGALGYRAPLLRIRAEVDLRQERIDLDGASARLGEALGLAVELSMLPEIARCRVSLARLHRRRGETATADEHLAAAVALYRELGATFWAERAQVEFDECR